MQDVQINTGSVQAPYLEMSRTLAPHQNTKVDYVFDSFSLLNVSIPDVLQVTFGGAAVQSKFSAGMGYKLTEPVYYVQFFNTSDQEINFDFSLAIGGIFDNRLTVSGNVDTTSTPAGSKNIIWQTVTNGGTVEISNNSRVSLLVSSGTATLTMNDGSIELSGGQTVEFTILSSTTLNIAGSGSVVQVQIEEF